MSRTDPAAEAEPGNGRRLDPAIRRIAEDGISGRTLLVAMGGVRGIVEALLPGLAFLTLFTLTKDLWLSVTAPAVIAVLFILARLLVRQSPAPAIWGLIGAVISGLLALRTDDGADYYVPGFFTNGAYAAAFLLSAVVGWPLIGVASGLLTGSGTAWRTHRRVRWWMTAATLVWAGFFLLRLAVQLPLYYAGNVEALGLTRLLMGTPLYALLLVLTVVFARAVLSSARLDGGADSSESAPSSKLS